MANSHCLHVTTAKATSVLWLTFIRLTKVCMNDKILCCGGLLPIIPGCSSTTSCGFLQITLLSPVCVISLVLLHSRGTEGIKRVIAF